jgi:SAM-dependent methyltransferase
MTAPHNDILRKVATYYTGKLQEYGPQHRGVDWNSVESQELRFEQLLKLCDGKTPFTINDYGCGYGALARYMTGRGYDFRYYGCDISEAMIQQAQRMMADLPHCAFQATSDPLNPADYTVASGIFNVKLETEVGAWEAYILDTLEHLAKCSKLGFAFNMLTAYSDEDRKRPDLYYGDPHFYFDHCRQKYSRHIALLHDYRLYEFTLIVRLS